MASTSDDTGTTTDQLEAMAIDRDWAAEATDQVVNVVDLVRKASTERIQKLVKLLVYGLFILFLGLVLALWAGVTLFRVVDNYLPPAEGSWSAWLVFGVVFTLAGIVLWAKRGRLIPKRA
ncbi:MAG: hypothetical protein AAGF02_05695 [Actinomycetota bacterium]